MNRIGIGILSLLSFMVGVCGREIEPPSRPYVLENLDGMKWTINYSTSQLDLVDEDVDASSNSVSVPVKPDLIKSTVHKDRNRRREVLTYSNNRRVEAWYVDGVELQETFRQPSSVMMIESRNGSYSRFHKLRSDFPELHWIDSAKYEDLEKIEGHVCYRFIRKVPRTAKEEEAVVPVPFLETVWIDANTRLPVQAEGEGLRLNYQFQKNSSNLPPMKPAFVKALERREAKLRKAKSYRMLPP